MYERRRNIVYRPDGKRVNVARARGQLFVCSGGCCCGRTEDGFAAVPVHLYHEEWERRKLRNIVHLTQGGCLGPCALANVALLLFDGQALWFHSLNTPDLVRALYDYIVAMLDADGVIPAPEALAAHQFTATTWQSRPDGAPVDDHRHWQTRQAAHGAASTGEPVESTTGHISTGSFVPLQIAGEETSVTANVVSSNATMSYLDVRAGAAGSGFPSEVITVPPAALAPRLHSADGSGDNDAHDACDPETLVMTLRGEAAAPRRNGELVFAAPWEGRAFGMAVALHDQGLFTWDEFRDRLVAIIRTAEVTGGAFIYYECWLAALEQLLEEKALLAPRDLEERTSEFEFGERDDVF